MKQSVSCYLVMFLAFSIWLYGCSKPPVQTPQDQTPPSIITPTPTSTPIPTTPTPLPTPTPVSKRYAPDGIYYTLRSISITTSDSIVGIRPGTRVTLVETLESGIKVTDGINTFKVKSEDLTNDLDRADAIADQENAKSKATQERIQNERITQQTAARTQAAQAEVDKAKQDRAYAIQSLKAKYDLLATEQARVTALISQSYQDESRQQWGRSMGRVTSKSELVQQRPELKAREVAIKQEMSRIQEQINVLSAQ